MHPCRAESISNPLLCTRISVGIDGFCLSLHAYMSSGVFDSSWWSDPRQDDTSDLWLWVFVAFNLHVFAAPQRKWIRCLAWVTDEAKPLFERLASIGLVMLVTALMHEQQTPDATSVRTSFWLWMAGSVDGWSFAVAHARI